MVNPSTAPPVSLWFKNLREPSERDEDSVSRALSAPKERKRSISLYELIIRAWRRLLLRLRALSSIDMGFEISAEVLGAAGRFAMIELWVKAFHIVAVISWMAGMFYLPRLFVYHVGAAPNSVQSDTFKLMERRLLRLIINPTMILVWVSGLWMAYSQGFFHAPWLHAKLALVLAMSALHGYFAGIVKSFAADRNVHSARFYRILNEVPPLIMAIIVVLVVVKPF
jgi:protoporphyrinogen IX oxidase